MAPPSNLNFKSVPFFIALVKCMGTGSRPLVAVDADEAVAHEAAVLLKSLLQKLPERGPLY